MKTVIIAPHPDDEWIGCGCTMLKRLNNSEKILVLIITRMLCSEKRLKVSEKLAKEYGYQLKILGELEKQINIEKLARFLKKNISKDDAIYFPSNDLHLDHQVISGIVKKNFKNKQMLEYATYNNSLNIFRRLTNKLAYYTRKQAVSSFRKGKHDFIFEYDLKIKNKHIKKFSETPRGGDVLRIVFHHKY